MENVIEMKELKRNIIESNVRNSSLWMRMFSVIHLLGEGSDKLIRVMDGTNNMWML